MANAKHVGVELKIWNEFSVMLKCQWEEIEGQHSGVEANDQKESIVWKFQTSGNS